MATFAPLDFSSGPRSDTKGNLGRPPGRWLGPLQGTLKNGKVLAEIFAAMAYTGDYEWSMMLSRLFYTCRRHKIEACGPVALWVWRCLRGVMMTLTAVFGDFGGSSRPIEAFIFISFIFISSFSSSSSSSSSSCSSSSSSPSSSSSCSSP